MKYSRSSAFAVFLASIVPIYTATNLFAADATTKIEKVANTPQAQAAVTEVKEVVKPKVSAPVSVNAPNINALDYQEIEEGGKFKDIDLKDYISDEDNKFSELKITLSGTKDLKATVVGGKLKVAIPDKNWNGRESVIVEVSDPAGLTSKAAVDYIVTSVNDAPEIKKIKGQKIKEGMKFEDVKLDDFITDEDHTDAQISWSVEVETVKSFQDEDLVIEITKDRIAKAVLPNENWYGLAKLKFTAMDLDGEEVSTEATYEVLSVNDAPVLKKIPAQKINEGEEFEEIYLDEFVTDADHEIESLKWSVSGAKELLVNLDQSSRTLSIKTPNEDWAGKPEKLKIEVQDPEGGKDKSELVLSVVSVNDEPEMGEIESQEIKEGQEFKPIDLEKLVTDKDHTINQLKWSFRGNKELKIQIGSDKKATIKIPNENWHGEENIAFIVTDPEGARAEAEASFMVESINDKPEVEKPFKGQTIKEGSEFKAVSLDQLVQDADHKDSEITWEVELTTTKKNFQETELEAMINDKRELIVKVPSVEYNGAAKIKLTATDPEGASISFTEEFEVQSVNDLPVFAQISDKKVQEGGEFETINLRNYVTDKDHDISKIKFEARGAKKLSVDIKDGVATVKIPSKEFSGPAEKVTFTAIDPEGGKAKIDVNFEVTPVNDAPVLKAIESQKIKEGAEFADFDLESLVSDEDDNYNKLKWTFPGSKNLQIKVVGKKAKVSIPHKNWHGSETITAKVTDPQGASAESAFTLTVESVNDIPEFKAVKGQKIKEGESFQEVKLAELVSDEDHKIENMTWTATAKKLSGASDGELKVTVDKQYNAIITTPSANWYGKSLITFTVADPEGGKASQTAEFEVLSVNDKPTIIKTPKLVINEGESFPEINLDDYVEDLDHAKSKLTWSVKGGKDLSFKINSKSRVANILIPSKEWEGKPETFTLTVEDPEGGKASIKFDAEVKAVNDAPVLAKFKDINVNEGDKFEDIELKSLVTDVDNKFTELKWTITGLKELSATVVGSKLKIKSPGKEWNGSETAIVAVEDAAGAKSTQELKISVKSVNDLPEVAKINDINIKEGASINALDLNKLVTDIDHKDSELTWDFNVKHKGPKADGELSIKVITGQAKFVVPSPDWYGNATVSWSVKDPEGGKASGSFEVNIASVNDKPVLKAPASQTIKEGEEFASFSLDDLISDVETPDSKISWDLKGGKDIVASIDSKKRVVTIKTPSKDWAGKPETFTLTAQDQDNAKVSEKFTLTVNPVNDIPVITNLNGQTIKEGEKFVDIDLKSAAKDVDHSDSQLKWTVVGQKALKVTVVGSKAKIATPTKEYNGEETLTFTVTDPEGGKASKELKFTVKSINDLPELKKVSDQKIKEGETFKTIDLKALSSDADHSFDELKWTASVISKEKKRSKKSKVKGPEVIVNDLGVAQIMLPSKQYNGSFDVKFTVTDPEGGKATQVSSFDVKSVNDLPVLSGFVSQTVKEGEKFKSISLNDKVSDADHPTSKIKWSFKGNKKLNASIDKKNNFIVTIPSKEWSGQETIELTAQDPEGGKAQIKLNYTVVEVNDLPIISTKLSGQTINEGESFNDIKLDDFVSDADHADSKLKWTVKGGKSLQASISGSRVLKVKVPTKEWSGAPEVFTVTVTDEAGASASKELTYTVKSVNDLPEIKKISGQKIKEGESFKTIELDKYVTDVDHSFDELKWTATVSPQGAKKAKRRSKKSKEPAGITVEISDSRIATIKTPNEDWFGAATITFTVVDGAKGKASTSADFEVQSVNDLPVLSGFKSQTIKEGGKFESISLNDKVSDKDHSDKQISWSFKGNKKLIASIDRKNNFIVKTPDKDWSGSEKIILEAKDKANGSAKIALVYAATPVNDLPKVKAIKAQTIKEGDKFDKIKLDDYVSDADHKDSEIKWTVTGAKDLKVSVTSTRQAIIEVPNDEWFGVETLTFIATDLEGAKDSTKVKFTVKSVNDAPEVSKIESQKIKEGQIFNPIDLKKYVKDADHKSSELIWYFTDTKPGAEPKKRSRRSKKKSSGPENGQNIGKNKLMLDLTKDGTLNVAIPDEDWNGEETFYFVARDPAGAESYTEVKFTVTEVNDIPKLSPIPDQVIKEGESFKPVSLDKYVDDPDHKDSKLKWQVKGGAKIKVSFNKSNRTLSFTTPSKDWSGSETVALRVKDPKNGISETSFRLKVTAVNDKPSIKNLPTLTVKEGKEFPVIDLNKYVVDADHEARRLVWRIKGGGSLKGNVSYDNKLSIVALSPSWSGSEKFTITVKDPEGAEDSYTFTAKVINVNDAPDGTRDSYTMDEGGVLKVSKDKGVLANDTDEDGPAPSIAELAKKPRNGTLKFGRDGSFTYTPNKGFNGADSFEYRAIDKQKAKSKNTRVDITVYFKMQDVRK